MSTASLIVPCPACDALNRLPGARLADAPSCGKCHQPIISGHPLVLDEASFDRHAGRGDLPLVVDFWAPWCGPCRVVHPVLEEINEERDDLKIVSLNIDDNPQTAQQYGVLSIPTMILLKDGAMVKQLVGAQPKRKILAELEPALQG